MPLHQSPEREGEGCMCHVTQCHVTLASADLEELHQPLGQGHVAGEELVRHHTQTLWQFLRRAVA